MRGAARIERVSLLETSGMKASRRNILKAIERTQREASNPWSVWGVRSGYRLRDVSGCDGHRFDKSVLQAEALARLEVLRGLL
jgi:hypothetical protein